MIPKKLTQINFNDSRTDVLILFAAGLVAFSLGFLIYFAKTQFITNPQVPLVQEELRNFTKQKSPLATIDITPFTQFVDPQSLIPTYQAFSAKELQLLREAIENCLFDRSQSKSPLLNKSLQFQKQLCQNRDISDSMLKIPPFFSVTGKSYAYLTFQNLKARIAPLDLKVWIQTHLPYFHVLELTELSKNFHVDTPDFPFAQLIGLPWQDLAQLTNGESVVITKSRVFLSLAGSLGQYQVFPLDDWTHYWQKSLFRPLRLQEVQDTSRCFIINSEVCWEYDYNRSLLTQWNPITLFIISLIAITFILFLQIALTLRQRKKEKERLTFSLEMLTHELRTPLANLTIQAEALRNHYEFLPAEAQMTSIRMLDQLAKVLRITESSSKYLGKSFTTALISPKFIYIDSIEDYFKSCVEPYSKNVELQISKAKDSQSILIDPYWTMICLTNLIRNAIDHGQDPILVIIKINQGSLQMVVQDAGTATFEPCLQSPSSQGMGLGLKLIDQILPYLLGDLTLTFNPTQFSLTFKMNNQSETNHQEKPNEKTARS